MKKAPTIKPVSRMPDEAEPTWEIANLFPAQGTWSEEEYLELSTNNLVEFSDGFLEVLPMPTTSHQLFVAYLYGLLLAFTTSRDLGAVLMAPLRVRLWRGKIREPDIVFLLKEHASRITEKFWKGADLVVEVVSGDDEDRRRDLVKKRLDYARARIPEYWIIDPREDMIIVLRLSGKRYIVHGECHRGETATSHLLQGFAVNVDMAFAHAASLGTAPKKKGKPKRSS